MSNKEQYSKFDPKKYLEQFANRKFELDQLHDIFASGNIHGKQLLDIGTGPSIHSIISASHYFEEIYLTDYAEQNLNFLTSWKNGDLPTQSDIIEYVLDKEGRGETIENRTEYLKKKIKAISTIDVTQSPIAQSDDVPSKYDAIISVECLDAAATTKEEYVQCVKNLGHLLKPGGHFILLGDLGESYFILENTRFKCLELSGEEVQNIFAECGFRIEYWQETIYPYPKVTDEPLPDSESDSDTASERNCNCEGLFAMVVTIPGK